MSSRRAVSKRNLSRGHRIATGWPVARMSHFEPLLRPEKHCDRCGCRMRRDQGYFETLCDPCRQALA